MFSLKTDGLEKLYDDPAILRHGNQIVGPSRGRDVLRYVFHTMSATPGPFPYWKLSVTLECVE